MRIKDYTDMVGHLTDSFNIPEARRMIAENPALTQEQFKSGWNRRTGCHALCAKKSGGKSLLT